MNMPGKYWRWTLPVSLFTAAVASAVGVYFGYHLGLHAYDDVLLDELLADMYYADNPVDCLPCDEGKKYEWFYVEAAVGQVRLEDVKPKKSVNDEND